MPPTPGTNHLLTPAYHTVGCVPSNQLDSNEVARMYVVIPKNWTEETPKITWSQNSDLGSVWGIFLGGPYVCYWYQMLISCGIAQRKIWMSLLESPITSIHIGYAIGTRWLQQRDELDVTCWLSSHDLDTVYCFKNQGCHLMVHLFFSLCLSFFLLGGMRA